MFSDCLSKGGFSTDCAASTSLVGGREAGVNGLWCRRYSAIGAINAMKRVVGVSCTGGRTLLFVARTPVDQPISEVDVRADRRIVEPPLRPPIGSLLQHACVAVEFTKKELAGGWRSMAAPGSRSASCRRSTAIAVPAFTDR
jgi:hypothetical protein